MTVLGRRGAVFQICIENYTQKKAWLKLLPSQGVGWGAYILKITLPSIAIIEYSILFYQGNIEIANSLYGSGLQNC